MRGNGPVVVIWEIKGGRGHQPERGSVLTVGDTVVGFAVIVKYRLLKQKNLDTQIIKCYTLLIIVFKVKRRYKMKAVVTVIGKDSVGIIAEVSAECSKYNANIVDITQSVLRDYFAMIMLVEIENMNTEFAKFQKALGQVGERKGLDIRAMHEDIFNTMHRI